MFVKRRLSACVALVGFCFSLLLVSIRPVAADDSSDYLLGYWVLYPSRQDFDATWQARQFPPNEEYIGVNSMPFRGKNWGAGTKVQDYQVGSYVGMTYAALGNWYPDIVFASQFSNPQAGHNLHCIIKFGVGFGSGSVSFRTTSANGYWFVGDRLYTSDNANVVFIGSSAWSTGLDLDFKGTSDKVFSDYTTGYCYRLDFDYIAQYGSDSSYAVSGLGMYFTDWCSEYVSSTHKYLGCIVGYVLSWADTGVVAIDDAITDILTHVSKIDGNVQSIYSILTQLLVVSKDIGIDTDTLVKLLTTINSNVALLQSDVSGIYELLKSALADESAELDKKTEQAAESIMQRTDSEKYWSDKNQDNFNALNIDKFSFGDGVVSALGVVGGLFSGLWDALGDGIIVYTFPLILGVALVLVGRLARSSGKGRNKSGSAGGDDK